MWEDRPKSCKVTNDPERQNSPEEGYDCTDLRQLSRTRCQQIGGSAPVDVNFVWELCNDSNKGIQADLDKSFVKFAGGAVINKATKPDGTIKLDSLNRPFEEQAVTVQGAPNWKGNVAPGTCRKIVATVEIDRCKATFDSELVIKYPGKNGARCTEAQKSGDWILRRCPDIYVSSEIEKDTRFAYVFFKLKY